MTIYAASSLVHVAVSAAHGGCLSGHSRPVEDGAPAKIWALDCPACSDHLRHDPLWSSTLSELPETHDEKISREDFDKRGARDKDQVLALALAKLAGVELPESLLRPITGNMPHRPVEALMECPNGHAGKPGFKFCATCGEPMQQPANALLPAAVSCPEGHPNAAGSKFCAECGAGMAKPAAGPQDGAPDGDLDYSRLHWKSLEKLCKERGLETTGTKAELVARLSEPQPVAA
jgi:hypothetical protein